MLLSLQWLPVSCWDKSTPTPWQAGAPGVQASALPNSCCRGPAVRPHLPGWSLQRSLLYLHVGLLPITSTTGPWKGVSPPPSLPCSQDPGEAVRPGSPDGHSGCSGQSWVTLPFTHHGAGGISLLPIPGGMDGALSGRCGPTHGRNGRAVPGRGPWQVTDWRLVPLPPVWPKCCVFAGIREPGQERTRVPG